MLLCVILRLYCPNINVSIVIPLQRQHYIYIYIYLYTTTAITQCKLQYYDQPPLPPPPPPRPPQHLLQCMHSVYVSTCNLHKGMPLNFCPYPQFNGMPLCKLTCACCIVHANGGGVVLTLCNLRWWSLSSTTVRMYSLAHAVV